MLGVYHHLWSTEQAAQKRFRSYHPQAWCASVVRKCGAQAWCAGVVRRCGPQAWSDQIGSDRIGSDRWSASVGVRHRVAPLESKALPVPGDSEAEKQVCGLQLIDALVDVSAVELHRCNWCIKVELIEPASTQGGRRCGRCRIKEPHDIPKQTKLVTSFSTNQTVNRLPVNILQSQLNNGNIINFLYK